MSYKAHFLPTVYPLHSKVPLNITFGCLYTRLDVYAHLLKWLACRS